MIDISGYKIERTLGKGGMASVYLAIQESFEREVALKVMNPGLSEDSKFSERFLGEAKIVSRLVHPNIVTVYDVGVHNQQHYLSMEYIPGQDLKHKRKQLTLKEGLKVVCDVARALDYACKKGYVHRDVKPENIMLHEDDGRAVLMDFGIACLADSASGMTQTGTAIGTPHYMSPEQAKGRAVDSRSDIYSLGVVLFLLITGHVPYDADSAVAVGIKHVSADVPRMSKCYAMLQPIIDKVLSKDPNDRYQTGAELIEAIEGITDDDIKAIELLSTRSFAAVPDTVSDTSSSVNSTGASQKVANTSYKNNPNLTTVSATALNTKTTASITDTSGVHNTLGDGQIIANVVRSKTGQQAGVTGSQKAALNGKTPTQTTGKNKVTKVSAKNKAVNGKTGANGVTKTGTQKKVNGKTGTQQVQNTNGQKNVTGKSGQQKSAGPQNLNAKTNVSQEAIAVSGNQAKVKTITSTTGESFYVDEEDLRDHQTELKNKISWLWSIAAVVIVATVGSLYFRAYFPPQISQPMDKLVAGGSEIKNNLFQQLGWTSTQPAENSNSELANDADQDNKLVFDNSDNSRDINSPNTEALSTQELASIDENSLGELDQAALGEARSLREGMKTDLSLAPKLVQLYRDILVQSPDMKNAEWGLRDVREFHERYIRDSFQDRDLETTKQYMASLDASFPGEMHADEKYASMLERIENAEKAQVFIDQANNYFQRDALSSPRGANAVESYRDALAIDPKNPLALAGLENVVQRYVELSQTNFDQGNYNDALQSASRGLAINTDNRTLIKLREDSNLILERQSKTEGLLQTARRQLEAGNLIEPKAESAFDRYNELLSFDRGNVDAEAGLREVERQLGIQIENYINRNQFDLAANLIDGSAELYPGSKKMEELSLNLATAKEADFIASQPKIPKLLVSETNPNSIDQPQQSTINVERTIHIGFSYENFVQGTSVVNAILWDGSRSVEIKAVPVIVSGEEGVKFFQIDRPVEGFAEGGYNIDFFLGDIKLQSTTFQVAK